MEDKTKEQKSDEIDLLELLHKTCSATKKFFNRIIRSVLLFIVFLVRNSLYIGGFIILGGMIGYGISKISRPYYASDMVVQPNAITASDMISYINRLHDLIKDRNYSELSKLLQLNDTISNQIKDIQAYWFIDKNKDGIADYIDYKNKLNVRDTTQRRLNNRVDVRVMIFNNQIFDSVRIGIANYFTQIPYINKLNQVRKQHTEELISKINNQIVKLDSLEDYDYFQKQKDMKPTGENGQIVLLNEQQVRLYHGEIIGLHKQRLTLEKELIVYPDPITIIEDFTPLTKKANPKSKYIMIYGLIFGLLGILILGFLETREKIKRYIAG